jgi:hypothetical protein
MPVNIALPFEPIQGISRELIFSPDQIDVIRNVAAGRDTSFSRTQALELLQSSSFSDKVRDFQLLLENGQESSEIRHLAARGLYKANTPEAVNILIENSQVQNERVLATVMKGLGRIGSENALEAIASLRERTTGVAVFQAEFAAALISHRLGLSGNDLRVPGNSEYLQPTSDTNRSFQVTRPSEDEAQVCLRSLADQPFGIEYSGNNLYSIKCGRNNWMLVLNQEFSNQDTVQILQSRKAFPGVIAAKYEETGLYSTAFLLFTSPTDQPNILNLLVHRATGEQVFGGTAQVEGSKANFSIRSISRPGGFPVNVEGSFEGGSLNFETTLSGTQVQERRHPIKVRSPLL